MNLRTCNPPERLTVLMFFLFMLFPLARSAQAGEWVQHPLDGTTWAYRAAGHDGVGVAKAVSSSLLFFNARTSTWTEHELDQPMNVVNLLADGCLVLVVGQQKAVVFNTLTSSVVELEYQGSLLSTVLPTRSFDCRSELAMVVTDQEFCVFDAEVDQWHRRPYTLPAPAGYTVRHQCHDHYAVSFLPLTSGQPVNLVYSLIQHDSNATDRGVGYLATPMDYGYAAPGQDTSRYYLGYSAVTNAFDLVEFPAALPAESVSISSSESIGLKTAYAGGYYEDYPDDIRHYHAYGFDTRHGQWQHELNIVDRTEVSLSAWRAGGTYCTVTWWDLPATDNLLVFDGTANSWHLEYLGLVHYGDFIRGGNVILGGDSGGMTGIDLDSGNRSSVANPYDSRTFPGLNYADYLSEGPGEDLVTINCYNGSANSWLQHTTGYHSSSGWGTAHVHLRVSGDPQREAIFYSAYRHELYPYSLAGWPTVSPRTTDNYTGVYNDSEGMAVLYDAHRGTVYSWSGFDRSGGGSRYYMTVNNENHDTKAYSLATGTWSSLTLEEDGVVYGGSDLIGLALSASGMYYNVFYAFDAGDGSWAVLHPDAVGGSYGVGGRTAFYVSTTSAYALGTGALTPVQMDFFTLQGGHGAVEARWECGLELGQSDLRVTAQGPAGAASNSWTVPVVGDGAGRFRALDSSPHLAPGGLFTYTLEMRGSGAGWVVAATEKISLQRLPTIELRSIHPNPFNPSTAIDFQLAVAQRVKLCVYDVAGHRVRVLRDGFLPAGQHVARWGGCDDAGRAMASGVYTVRLEATAGGQRKKVLLVR